MEGRSQQRCNNALQAYKNGGGNKNVLYIDVLPKTPCSLAWLVAGRNTLGGESLWYRTDCGTVQSVLLGAVHSHVPARSAARQIFCYKWGAVGWREKLMFMFDWSALMTPQKAILDSFVDLYPIDVSNLNFNILCMLLL